MKGTDQLDGDTALKRWMIANLPLKTLIGAMVDHNRQMKESSPGI